MAKLRLSILALFAGISPLFAQSETPILTVINGQRNTPSTLPQTAIGGDPTPLLAVPAGEPVPVRGGTMPCRTGCAGHYDSAHAYVPDQDPDRLPRGMCERGCLPCPDWYGGAYYFLGWTNDIAGLNRDFGSGIGAYFGQRLGDCRRVGVDVGGLVFRQTYDEEVGPTSTDTPLWFWTVDANIRALLGEQDGFRFGGLAGYRFLHLREGLSIRTPGVASEWTTRNIAHAGQIGAFTDWTLGPYFAEGAVKVGLGVINGRGRFNGTVTRSETEFVVIPEMLVRGGYNFGSGIRGTIGYQIFYVDRVIRPADRGGPELFLHGLTVGIEGRY